MLAGKIRIEVCQNFFRKRELGSRFHPVQLQQKAFPQVSCPYSGRVEILNDFQHLNHFFFRGFYAGPERKVVHEAFRIPPEITVVVETADNEGSDRPLMLRKVTETELVHETLCETFLDGERIVLRTFVLAVVVHAQLVSRNRIVILVVRKRDLTGSFLLLVVLIGYILVQNRIFLQFLADSLFQFLGR